MKPLDREAMLDNISITGAGMLLLADPDDKIGDIVEVRIRGAWGRMQIRRYEPTGDSAVSFWGVEFLRPAGEFHAAISSLISYDPLAESDAAMHG
jgi:hypothetical protein